MLSCIVYSFQKGFLIWSSTVGYSNLGLGSTFSYNTVSLIPWQVWEDLSSMCFHKLVHMLFLYVSKQYGMVIAGLPV